MNQIKEVWLKLLLKILPSQLQYEQLLQLMKLKYMTSQQLIWKSLSPVVAEDAQLSQNLKRSKASSLENPIVLVTPTSVPDEELDSYFNAPIT